MDQSKGTRLESQRLSHLRVGRVRYSTRRFSVRSVPSAARRAMPTSLTSCCTATSFFLLYIRSFFVFSQALYAGYAICFPHCRTAHNGHQTPCALHCGKAGGHGRALAELLCSQLQRWPWASDLPPLSIRSCRQYCSIPCPT